MHPSGSSHHDDKLDMPKPQRAAKTTSLGTPKATPLPRLNSPPPPPAPSSGSSRAAANTSRKADQLQPQPSIPTLNAPAVDHSVREDSGIHRSGARTPNRNTSAAGGPLETVEENSAPTTPLGGESQSQEKSTLQEQPERNDGNPMDEAFARHQKVPSEGSIETSEGKKKVEDDSQEGWKPATSSTGASAKVPAIHSRKSYTNLPSKLKSAAEGTTKNMTVETETVSSIPQVAVGGGAGERKGPGRTDSGSLRLKESTETIRPKKEKKRAVRKTASLNAGTGGYQSRHFLRPISTKFPSSELEADSFSESTWTSSTRVEDDPFSPMNLDSPTGATSSGRSSFSIQNPPGTPFRSWSFGLITFRGRTASSKADIFEAKVASAVGEADSSDTEETFVYESSPPEPPSRKVHSRTPSTASTFSQADPYGVKHRQESQQALAKKRSMKFATNYNTVTNEGEGTVRSTSHQSGRASTPHHHHIGRFGRGGHGSVHDKESSTAHSPKTPRTAASQLQQFSNQHGNRQRSPNIMRLGNSSRKAEEGLSYDLEGEGADDERAPLVGSVRSGRNRRRPLPGSVRQVYANEDRQHKYCGRVTAFASLGSLLAILIAAIVIILILCTKPLEQVRVTAIRNVLASESEIMLDLSVKAINPNIIAITVTDLDLNIFAKSRHIKPIVDPSSPSSASSTTRRSSARNTARSTPPDPRSDQTPIHRTGKDEGTDPMPYPEDPSSDAQTMLLGPIYKFDSPLTFDASPLHHYPSTSSGEVRLSRPGNKTEEGGSARWERVLQHDFELIVRGVVKYSLPISSRVRSASIGGKVVVHPNEDDESEGNKGGMRLSRPRARKGMDDGSNVIIEPPLLWDNRRTSDHGH